MKGQEQLSPVYGQSDYYGEIEKADCNNYRCNQSIAYGRKKDMNQPIAMAYVPWQQFDKIYAPKDGLCQGTIFPELNLKFCGERGVFR